jgi:hypothetical protein
MLETVPTETFAAFRNEDSSHMVMANEDCYIDCRGDVKLLFSLFGTS